MQNHNIFHLQGVLQGPPPLQWVYSIPAFCRGQGRCRAPAVQTLIETRGCRPFSMKSYNHTFQCSHALIPIHNLSTQIVHFAEMFILSNIEMIFTQIIGFAYSKVSCFPKKDEKTSGVILLLTSMVTGN